MTKQTINVGTSPNDRRGDSLRAAFQKVNANFTELYTSLGLDVAPLNLGAFEFTGSTLSTTDSSSITIDQATTITSNLTVGGDLLPSSANGGDLGSAARPWKSLYVSNNTIFFGGTPLSLDANNNLTVNGSPVTGGTADLGNLKIDGQTLGTKGADSNSWGSYPLYLDPGGESDAGILIPGLTGQSNGDALAIYNRSDASSIVQVFGQGGVQVVTNTGVTEKIFEFTDNGTLNVPYPSQDSFRIRLGSENFVSRPGKATLTLTGDAWDFYGAFASSQNGERQLAADNGPLPSLTNPGYEDGDTFEIDSTVHGIPGYVLTVALSNVVQAGPAGWTANLAFSPPPDYPSTVNSQGAIKVTSNDNSWIFGTDGELTLPAGGDIVDSTGTSVIGGVSPTQPYLELTNEAFITQPVVLGTPVTITAAPQGVGAQVVVTITEGSVLDSITIFEPGTGYVAGQNYIIWSYQIGGPTATDSLTFTIGTVDENGGILTVTNAQFLGVQQNVAGVYVTALTYQASVFDEIDTGLTLTRDLNQGIYNVEAETEYDNSTYLSPLGTEWNADGWGDLTGLATRTYTTWRQALNNQVGNYIVASELVMHDTINDKYYKFDFTAWAGNNGSYAYTRTEVTDPNYFRKTDNGNEVDIIIADDGDGAGVGITRDGNNGIYNPYREGSWDETVSPGGIGWNIDGWADLSDVESRTYINLYAAFGFGGLGNKIVGTECVIYVPDNGKYYAVKFSAWTQGGGGGFSYTRKEIDLTKVNEGVKFSDGTVLKSAQGIGRVKSTAAGNRRIEEVTGYNQVAVTQIVTTNLTTVASRAETSGYYIWIDSTATTIDDIINTPANYGDAYGFEFSLNNTIWYTWTGGIGNSGNSTGYSVSQPLTYLQDDTVYFRYKTGGGSVVWWDKVDLPGGSGNFRGAVIDYHAYTGDGTIIGTIHIVDDDGEEHISHQEVQSGSTDGENDDLWLVTSEGQIRYRRIDGESATLKIHWTAKVFYGSEYYD